MDIYGKIKSLDIDIDARFKRKIVRVYQSDFENSTKPRPCYDTGVRYLCNDGIILRYLAKGGWQIWTPSLFVFGFDDLSSFTEWVPLSKTKRGKRYGNN